MPRGASYLGDNRFALLSESPKAKKRKKPQKLDLSFPDLPTTARKTAKYVVVASHNTDKKIADFSCFGVNRSLHLISKNILNIKNTRDGNLTLLVESQSDAEKFLKAKELPGICQISCKLHESLNFVKGTVYAPYLNNIPEEEIITELSSQKVTGVYKFVKIHDGTPKPSGVVLLTFELFDLPSKIDISWHTVKVREYIPNPMRCKTCQYLGHTAKHCRNTPLCVNCGLPPHMPDDCSQTKCVNCLLNHPASSRECPKYIQQKEILKIKITKKCTIGEAKAIFKSALPTCENTPLYSSLFVTSEKEQNITSNNTKNTIQKSPAVTTPLLSVSYTASSSTKNTPNSKSNFSPQVNTTTYNKINQNQHFESTLSTSSSPISTIQTPQLNNEKEIPKSPLLTSTQPLSISAMQQFTSHNEYTNSSLSIYSTPITQTQYSSSLLSASNSPLSTYSSPQSIYISEHSNDENEHTNSPYLTFNLPQSTNSTPQISSNDLTTTQSVTFNDSTDTR